MLGDLRQPEQQQQLTQDGQLKPTTASKQRSSCHYHNNNQNNSTKQKTLTSTSSVHPLSLDSVSNQVQLYFTFCGFYSGGPSAGSPLLLSPCETNNNTRIDLTSQPMRLPCFAFSFFYFSFMHPCCIICKASPSPIFHPPAYHVPSRNSWRFESIICYCWNQ